MAEDPDNLVLHMLRRVDKSVSETREDLRDPQVPVTQLGEGVAELSRGLGRFGACVDRTQRRFEPTEAGL